MCMEDVRIGRRKLTLSRFVDVPTSWKKIANANAKRTRITVQNTTTGSVFVWVDPNSGTTTGFHVTRTLTPLALDVENEGQVATADLYAIASGAAQRLVILETILQEE